MTGERRTTVLVVGAGPAGLAAANLLGQFGLRTTVIEQEEELNREPRAVSIDDEAMRLLQRLGLGEAARSVVRPGTGTRFYGAGGRLLASSPAATDQVLGHPAKNPIDHGAFQRFLHESLASSPSVEVRFRTALVELSQDTEGVTATVTSPDGEERIRADYVLGCDGGRSTTRGLIGVEMEGFSAPDVWLIVDVRHDPHDQRFAMHHGDPRRPHVIVPGGEGRCRYEFRLHPGEDHDRTASFEFARDLLRPHRGDLPAGDVIRQQVYAFHALLASRWRVGRVLLLGDAAHMMPPFAGQGLNSGLRDAANLAWKLAAVESRRLEQSALETYEMERRPDAEATIRFSVTRGRVMMTTNRLRAGIRDAIGRAARTVAFARRRLDRLPPKPYARYGGGMIVASGAQDGIAGAMLPQPKMLLADGSFVPLDELLGGWFALIGVDLDGVGLGQLRSDVWGWLGVKRVELVVGERYPEGGKSADADGPLSSMLAPYRGQIVVVRPDRFVLGAFRPVEEEQFIGRWRSLGLRPASPPTPEPAIEKEPARSVQ